MNEPWSKKHKRVFRDCRYSLSNSFAQPLTQEELIQLTHARGDQTILNEYNRHSLVYTPNGGSADLRYEISKLYGDDITPDNIIVFPGAQVALQTAAFAFAKQCHSIVFTPGYQSTIEAPIQAGGKVTKIQLKASNGWNIDPKDVIAAVEHDTKYMVLNQPYNPAGTVISINIYKRLCEIAKCHDMILLCDEVYRFLEHDSSKRLPAMADYYKKGISCVTLSKPWGGCGITIGWLAIRDMSMKRQLMDVQYFSTACPSRASEIQAIMVLRSSKTILEKNLCIIRKNLIRLDQFMSDYSDLFDWVRPTAGAIGFVKFKGPMSADELGTMLAKKASLSIKPFYCFTDPKSSSPDIDHDDDDDVWFRLGYGEENMPIALDVLISFLDKHKEEWRSVMSSGVR